MPERSDIRFEGSGDIAFCILTDAHRRVGADSLSWAAVYSRTIEGACQAIHSCHLSIQKAKQVIAPPERILKSSDRNEAKTDHPY